MNAFDPQQFSKLLKKLIGGRKVKDFALETEISRYQISRRLAGTLDGPPRKKTLKVFASHAYNGVTYNELLECCGYDPDDDDVFPKPSSDSLKTARTVLLSEINEFYLPVTLQGNSSSSLWDFALTLGSDPELTWGFKYLPANSTRVLVEQVLHESYVSLLYNRLAAYSKYSFLTSSPSVYSACDKKRPENLNANVSAILYSADTLEILSEKKLSSSVTAPVPDTLFFKEGK